MDAAFAKHPAALRHDAEEVLDPGTGAYAFDLAALRSEAWVDAGEVEGAYRFVRRLLGDRAAVPGRRDDDRSAAPRRPAAPRA